MQYWDSPLGPITQQQARPRVVAASSLLAFAVRKVETMERMTGYRRTRRMSAVAVQAL